MSVLLHSLESFEVVLCRVTSGVGVLGERLPV